MSYSDRGGRLLVLESYLPDFLLHYKCVIKNERITNVKF